MKKLTKMNPLPFLRRYRGAAIIVVVFAIICSLSSLVVTDVLKIQADSYQFITNTVSIITSLVLLAVAITVYQKFSSNQSILDSQTKNVIDIVAFLADTRFMLSSKNNKKDTLTLLNVDIFRLEDSLDFKDRKIGGFDPNKTLQYAETNLQTWCVQLESMANNPYTPKHIAKSIIDNFGLQMCGAKYKNELTEPYYLLSVQGFKNDYEDNVLADLNRKPINIKDVIYDMRKIYNECAAWLQETNGELFSSLNIQNVKSKR
jgi:hypothetical protein